MKTNTTNKTKRKCDHTKDKGIKFCDKCKALVVEKDLGIKISDLSHQPDKTSDWRESLVELFHEDDNHHLHLIDGSNTLEDFIQSLLDQQEKCHQREMGEARKEERSKVLEKIDDEIGHFTNGCGCCMDTTVSKELIQLFPDQISQSIKDKRR